MGKKRSFAQHSVRMGWRGLLAISNRPRERLFAQQSVRMGWGGLPNSAEPLQSLPYPIDQEKKKNPFS